MGWEFKGESVKKEPIGRHSFEYHILSAMDLDPILQVFQTEDRGFDVPFTDYPGRGKPEVNTVGERVQHKAVLFAWRYDPLQDKRIDDGLPFSGNPYGRGKTKVQNVVVCATDLRGREDTDIPPTLRRLKLHGRHIVKQHRFRPSEKFVPKPRVYPGHGQCPFLPGRLELVTNSLDNVTVLIEKTVYIKATEKQH